MEILYFFYGSRRFYLRRSEYRVWLLLSCPAPLPPPLPKRQPRSFITYDISRVQDHNVIHLENADDKVDLVWIQLVKLDRMGSGVSLEKRSALSSSLDSLDWRVVALLSEKVIFSLLERSRSLRREHSWHTYYIPFQPHLTLSLTNLPCFSNTNRKPLGSIAPFIMGHCP